MADGWRCPDCRLVLAPHVEEHRCEPPTAGVTTVAPPAPFTPTSNITITAPYAVTATTGHLGVNTGYLTEVTRLEIAGGAAA